MKLTLLALGVCLSACGAGRGTADVRIDCAEPKGWTFAVSTEAAGAGREVVTVKAVAHEASVPPAFSVSLRAPGAGVHRVWTSAYHQEGFHLWPQAWKDWKSDYSELAYETPVAVAFDENGRAKLALAASEVFERVRFGIVASESTGELLCHCDYFSVPAAPRERYETRILVDWRDAAWADAVRGAADWISATSGFRAAEVPEAAYDPLYSTWYAYMQDVHADELEREAKLAAALGMKTMILDDGWQKVQSKSFYSATGDWNPVPSRFPDMKAHVAAVHRAGLKYMLWFAVPLVGNESQAWTRFKDKLLYGADADNGTLDPRFPEVREYLIGLYERAVRDWGFDGLKLDFIDAFVLTGPDPVEKEGMRGRDIREVPQAVDRLMKDVLARLKKIRPDVLIEFRQHYIGPAIRQYGNMLRAADCPNDPPANRRRIADLRLTSGDTAVHADMLAWSADETPAGAARPILSAIFGTIQYSMILQKLPEGHRAVIRHWLGFSQMHRATLLKGAFRPYHPEAGYPLIEAESAAERIVAVYLNGYAAPLGAPDKPVYLLNGSPSDTVLVESPVSAQATAYGPDGTKVGDRTVSAGCSRVSVPSGGYLVVAARTATEPEIVVENAQMRLTLGADATVKSLIVKRTGEELLDAREGLSLFSVTQDRPFNNELKLAHPNCETTYRATSVKRAGDLLTVAFAPLSYAAKIRVAERDGYALFELVDFDLGKAGSNGLDMTYPPVRSLRLLDLPVRNRANFGEWMNVAWDESAAVAVLGAEPYTWIDSEARCGFRRLRAEARDGLRIRGAKAALVACETSAFLDAVDAFERDEGLPRGVMSRRSADMRRSTYWTSEIGPSTVDAHIARAKRGGFTQMLICFPAVCKGAQGDNWWGGIGDYELSDAYADGFASLKAMLAKLKAAGIAPGLHVMQTFIGLKSRYVTPVADPRLNLKRHFTLAKPLAQEGGDVFVQEDPSGSPTNVLSRILVFGGELLSYESFTTERPYRFTGVRRGHLATTVVAHPRGQIGGILDVCEYQGRSCYIDQNSDLQDEIAEKIARIYDCGFEFIYCDGSEGVNVPQGIHVANAQYRVWKRLGQTPRFLEGAAKSHFGWHFQSGGNAFDVFPPEQFKEMIVRWPQTEAASLRQDFTRVDFGWWGMYLPDANTTGVQYDHWEFGESRAAAWDCPVSVQVTSAWFDKHPRRDDLLEVLRRWEDVRVNDRLTPAEKEALKSKTQEHHLYLNEKGEYELHPIRLLSARAKHLRGFVFARNGKRVVACWHTHGKGRLRLQLDRPIETELAGIRYFETTLSEDEVAKAFAAADCM